jgi:hypothetical protein
LEITGHLTGDKRHLSRLVFQGNVSGAALATSAAFAMSFAITTRTASTAQAKYADNGGYNDQMDQRKNSGTGDVVIMRIAVFFASSEYQRIVLLISLERMDIPNISIY